MSTTIDMEGKMKCCCFFFPALKGYFVHSMDSTKEQPYHVTPFYHFTMSGTLTSLPEIPRFSPTDSALKLVRNAYVEDIHLLTLF